jgi:hypothetical protein
MEGLYPIIRRVRRPLVSNQPAAASVVANTGQTTLRREEVVEPTSNIEGQDGARQEVLPHGQRPTLDERKERYARKTKEA